MIQHRVFACLAAFLLHASAARAEELTPESAIERAFAGNPSLRAAMHDLTAAGQGLSAEDGTRLPVLFAAADANLTERFNAARAGIVRNEDLVGNADLGVRYTTPIATVLEVGVQSTTSTRTTLINPAGTETVSIGPNYSGQVYLNARQPLLRGAGPDSVLGPLRQARASKEQSAQERDRAASQLVLDVLGAYWELWFAERSLAVQVEAEKLGVEQLARVNRRIEELGSASRTDALRFAAELTQIREALVQARAVRQARAIELGRLLGEKPMQAVAYSVSRDSPPPVVVPELLSLDAKVRALSSELKAMQAQVEVLRERSRVADNANAPRLDLLATGAMSGLWTDDNLPGLSLSGGRPAFGAMLGLELELPVGRSRESAEAARARELLLAAEARLQALSDILAAEVASVHAEVELAEQRVELASESATIAGQLAEAERARLELGSATSLDVVIAQQNQRASELRRLRVVVDQSTARYRLDHQSGALLERYARLLRENPPT